MLARKLLSEAGAPRPLTAEGGDTTGGKTWSARSKFTMLHRPESSWVLDQEFALPPGYRRADYSRLSKPLPPWVRSEPGPNHRSFELVVNPRTARALGRGFIVIPSSDRNRRSFEIDVRVWRDTVSSSQNSTVVRASSAKNSTKLSSVLYSQGVRGVRGIWPPCGKPCRSWFKHTR